MQLEEALDALIDSKLEAVHTAFPAIVQSYDGHSKRTCTVIPATNLMLSDGTIVEAVPISGVPVVFPSSQAGGVLFPIKKGDSVIVVVCEGSIGNWLAGKGTVVDPEDSTRFTMHDAVCIPGLWPLGNMPTTTMAAKSAGLEFNDAAIEITSKGKFKIRNELATAKELMDDLWVEMEGMRMDLFTWANAINATGGAPVLGSAFAPIVASLTARMTSISTKSAKVANLLE